MEAVRQCVAGVPAARYRRPAERHLRASPPFTTAWTGCRWGEVAGPQRDQVDLDHGTIDPDIGALHESARGLWLGPH